MMPPDKPILVTGSHRSGTTWVGRIIAASPAVAYIHEPFNIYHDIGVCGAQFRHWFTYIAEQNEQEFYNHIRNTLNFRYNWVRKLKKIKTSRNVGSLITRPISFLIYRRSHVRPLLKDPNALFSAEWLESRFGMNIILLIRHPAAFAGSLKAKNWTHPFSHFLEQPMLMQDHLWPFEAEIREFSERTQDIIEQAALLWKLIHYTIMKYQRGHDDWILIRHEDLSQDPLTGFKAIFTKLDLDFSSQIVKIIEKYSHLSSSIFLNRNRGLRRDSVSNIRNWKKRLTEMEIKKIRGRVEEISHVFYSDQDW